MANMTKVTAQSGADNAVIAKFISDITDIRNGAKTFTVNAPNGITINGYRFEQGETAPVVNAKLFGYSLPVALITNDDIRAIVAYVRQYDMSDILATVAKATAKGYRHADRVNALMAVVASGKPTTADKMTALVESAKAARSTGKRSAVAVSEISDTDIDGMLGAL